MREYKNKKHIVLFYDSEQDLPIRQYQKFNKNLMISSEVGNTITDFDQRETKINKFLKAGLAKEALQEQQNKRQCFYNAIQEYSPSNIATAYLVYSINGRCYTKKDEQGIKQILDKLDEIGFSERASKEVNREVKKKLMNRLDYISLISFLTTLSVLILFVWLIIKLVLKLF